MNSLLWKQWRETKGSLALCTAWMILAVCYSIGYELGYHHRAVVGGFSGAALFYSWFAAIFLAMRTARGEQTDGTMSFSESLPISLRRMGTVRLVSAILTLGIPILLAAAILSVALASGLVEQGEPRVTGNFTSLPQRHPAGLATCLEQVASVTTIAIMGGVELLLLLAVLGCYLRSQAQIGFAGAVMAVALMVASGMSLDGRGRSPTRPPN